MRSSQQRKNGPKRKARVHFSPQYNYVRSRQLENSMSDDPTVGAWVITSLRVGYGWGAVPEEAWPYDGDATHWPPAEPPGLDAMAKTWRSGPYQRVRTLQECRQCLASDALVILGVRTTDQWFHASDGIIEVPSNEADLTGSHTVTLVGYDDAPRLLKFVNSWGESWGDQGFGYLPYDYFQRFLQEAWTKSSNSKPETRSGTGIVDHQWGAPDLFGDVLHCIDVYAPASDDYLGWGFAVVRDGYLEVEELFVMPSHRRQGIGTSLVSMFIGRASKLGLPLRLWVSHADVSSSNLATFARLIKRQGMTLERSKVAWASYVAVAR